MLVQLRAILWAQFRAQRNFYLRSNRRSVLFTWLGGLLWYGLWVLQGLGAAYLTGGGLSPQLLRQTLPIALFVIFCAWQLFPILLASSGAFLDVRRLVAYPIPTRQLFLLEVALRVSTGLEMLLVILGACVGLLWNAEMPVWTPLPLLVFAACNLFLATGLKPVLERLLQRRWMREVLTLGLIVLLLLPQWLAMRGLPPRLERMLDDVAGVGALLLWNAAGSAAAGEPGLISFATMAFWTALTLRFAHTQFARSLRLEESDTSQPERRRTHSLIDRLYRLPSRVFGDPLAAVMEKDLRGLARAPRFRLILLMSCTMGQLLWLPVTLQSDDGFVSSHHLTLSMVYGMMVLGDVLFWNVFGMERGGVQAWFVTPVSMGMVLRAKNLVAAFYLCVCWLAISGIVLLLPVRIQPAQFAESIAVAAVMGTILLGVGNLASVHAPRAVDPGQAWRNSSTGKVQAFMLMVYPLVSIPISLAYLARWAVGKESAFYSVLGIDLVLALLFYSVATESAAEEAEAGKEEMVAALTASQREGPISLT